MSNARYRPHTKSGPKDGRTLEEMAVAAANERFVTAFKKAAARNGWAVREGWA